MHIYVYAFVILITNIVFRFILCFGIQSACILTTLRNILLGESNINREYMYALFIVITARKKIEECACMCDGLMTIRYYAYVCVCLCEYT
jgi:hypothetical protein